MSSDIPRFPPAAPRGISVVIPCLDEAGSIATVVAQALVGILASGLPGEVIVVDNGSTDGSAALASAAGARVIAESARGYGSAIRRGFNEARFEYLVMGDGDLTYDFAVIKPFIDLLDGNRADLVVGNRWGDMRDGAMPFLHRYIGNPALSLTLRVLFRTNRVHDAHCGLRALRRSAWERLGCVTTGMEFASEMIVRAVHEHLRLKEIPIAYHPRVGESKLSSFRDGWRHLRFMLLHSPTWVLLLPGSLTWALSLVLLWAIAVAEIQVHNRVLNIHSMLLGGLLNITSMQMLSIGTLSKAYAHFVGLRRDPLIVWFYQHFTFERLLLFTLPLTLLGVVLTVWVIAGWATSGYGPLNEVKVLFFAILCLINGTQIGATGYLLSIMALPRPRGA